MRIADIRVGKRFRKDMGDIDALAASIAEVGLLQPIVVREDGTLVAGARRLEACRRLGWTDIPVFVVRTAEDVLMALKAERDENVCRKDLAPSEAVAIAAAIEPLEREAARKRKAVRSENFSDVKPEEKGKALDKVAAAVGMSRPTLLKARAVVESGDTELIKLMDTSGNVHRAYQELKRKNLPPSLPLPDGVYDVIYADPPWQFDNSGFAQSAEAIYPTMATDDICALPIANISAENSVLFLWAANAILPDALQVMRAWGFEYKTNVVWCKDRSPGIGWFTNSKHELLLIGTRGSKHPVFKPDSWQRFPQRGHSEKPSEFYDIIECMYPNGSYLELFARNVREGWKAWGNEIIRENESCD